MARSDMRAVMRRARRYNGAIAPAACVHIEEMP